MTSFKSSRIIRHEKIWEKWDPWEDQIDSKAYMRNLNEAGWIKWDPWEDQIDSKAYMRWDPWEDQIDSTPHMGF